MAPLCGLRVFYILYQDFKISYETAKASVLILNENMIEFNCIIMVNRIEIN